MDWMWRRRSLWELMWRGWLYRFLQAAAESEEALHELVEVLVAEITTVLFCTGTGSLPGLREPGFGEAVEMMRR